LIFQPLVILQKPLMGLIYKEYNQLLE